MAPRTYPDAPSLDRIRRARTGRRVGIGALALLVGVALLGFLGPRMATVSEAAGGYELEVAYPAATRAGMTTGLSFDLRRDGGFDGPITVAMPLRYLELFDLHRMLPEPASSTATDDRVLWEFDPPPGERLTVTFDARLETGRYLGRSAFVSVVEDGDEVVRVTFRTMLVP